MRKTNLGLLIYWRRIFVILAIALGQMAVSSIGIAHGNRIWGSHRDEPFPFRVVVTGDKVNIRMGSSTNSRIVSHANKGDTFTAFGLDSGWVQVILPEGKKGYIYGKLVVPYWGEIPENDEAKITEHLQRGNELFYQRDFDGAIAEYKSAQEISENHPNVHYNLANAYAEKGWEEEAVNEHLKALSLNPDHVGSLYNLGLIYFQQGKYDLAATEWEKALAIDPEHAGCAFNLALAYEALGSEKARSMWERFLELAKDNPEFSTLVEEVKSYIGKSDEEVHGGGN